MPVVSTVKTIVHRKCLSRLYVRYALFLLLVFLLATVLIGSPYKCQQICSTCAGGSAGIPSDTPWDVARSINSAQSHETESGPTARSPESEGNTARGVRTTSVGKQTLDFQAWTPNATRLSRVLSYLDLPANHSSSLLPVTLDSPFLLSNDTLCATVDGSPVDILFVVHSAPGHFQQRSQMRSTFMARGNFRRFGFEVRGVFLLGQVDNSSLQLLLDNEHATHGDLVQGEFLDSYHNISHKGVMGYRWITQHCSHTRFVVKLDDDVFFDTYRLILRYWTSLMLMRRSFVCKVWLKGRLPIQRGGKWGVPDNQFFGLDYYPYTYCSGFAVMMTGDLVPSLFAAAQIAPVFWIDDVYLFGILPDLASNITYYDPGFGAIELDVKDAQRCMDLKADDCPLLAVVTEGKFEVREFSKKWSKTLSLHLGSGLQAPMESV